MSGYRLTGDALDDLEGLLYGMAVRAGWDVSMKTEERLFATFDAIGKNPGIGHLREDLIPHRLYFIFSAPCMVAYRRDTEPVTILAVIHGARDVASLLQDRLG